MNCLKYFTIRFLFFILREEKIDQELESGLKLVGVPLWFGEETTAQNA